jgi:hypothetical protein
MPASRATAIRAGAWRHRLIRRRAFEHIYRHHRRYRIAEGSEEIQMRKVAVFLFGYVGPRREELCKITWDDVDYRKRPYGRWLRRP